MVNKSMNLIIEFNDLMIRFLKRGNFEIRKVPDAFNGIKILSVVSERSIICQSRHTNDLIKGSRFTNRMNLNIRLFRISSNSPAMIITLGCVDFTSMLTT